MPLILPTGGLSAGYQREQLRLTHQSRTHGIAVAAAGYAYVPAGHGNLSQIAGSEATTGTLTGYARRTFTPTYADDGTEATVSIASRVTIATASTGTATGYWIYVEISASDANRFIVGFWPFAGGASVNFSNTDIHVDPHTFRRAP